ncbi:hypothetical protein ACI6QG_12835 [Roseococcus sp. DSY-14]|uniref:hypothetical protein n=1 Tax=Roseococcus sp. DSY-14 TaxID=3369650 RepID=UPI00387B7F3C
MSLPSPALRELTRSAGQASDAQLLRLVQMLDAMPSRGAADMVLAPLRCRLRRLRPSRPLGVTRLLFLPMDALVVPAKDWRPGRGQIPRTALCPLAAALEAQHPAIFAEANAALAGRTTADLHLVSEWGARLWLLAGESLGARPPPGWEETSLPASTYASVAVVCRTLWRYGPMAWRLRLAGPDGPPEALARPMLRGVAADGPEALGVVLAALLPFAAQPGALTQMASAMGRQLSAIADQALDRFLADAPPALAPEELEAAPDALERLTTVLEDLEANLPAGKPQRLQQVAGMRQAAGTACLRRLEQEGGPQLAQALAQLAARPEVADAEVELLEERAAALRALVDAARRLERGPLADKALRPAVTMLTQLAARLPAAGRGLRRADALRLLELLGEGDAAARLLPA